MSSCSQAITDYLAAREEEVVNTVETIFEESTTFSEKVKRRISMEKLSLLEKALPVTILLVNSTKPNHNDVLQVKTNDLDETIQLNER